MSFFFKAVALPGVSLVTSSNPRLSTEEAALARAAKSGDRAALGAIYERYSRMAYGILLANTGRRVSPAAMQDLLQEVFLKVLQQLGSLRDPDAIGGWIASIARRTAADYFRAPKIESLDGYDRATSSTPVDEAQAALECIRKLPPAYRETLVLRLVEGMTGPEIAAQTGMTPDSVRVNLCRGMKMLRASLESGTGKQQ